MSNYKSGFWFIAFTALLLNSFKYKSSVSSTSLPVYFEGFFDDEDDKNKK